MKNQNPSSQQLQPIVNLFTQKRYKQTLSESSQMLKKFPNSIILFNIIGASNAALMQFDAAIESYKKALEIQPDYADANNNMGIAFNEMGDSIEAIDCFKNALKINPNHPDAYNNMGIALNEKGESKAAIES